MQISHCSSGSSAAEMVMRCLLGQMKANGEVSCSSQQQAGSASLVSVIPLPKDQKDGLWGSSFWPEAFCFRKKKGSLSAFSSPLVIL